jgi:hypothetical protein
MNEEQAIAKMRELGIAYIHFNFMCGGDSMGDTDFVFHNSKDEEITENVGELESYLEDEVYRNVEFYEASDGHYCGEAGHVHIEIDEDEDELTYCKCSQSEWSESVDCKIEVELTDEEKEFVETYVEDFNGGEDDDTNVNYSKDFIMTDKQDEMVKSIINKIDKAVEDCEPDYNGEPQDWYNFSTEDLTFEENNLIVNGYFYEYIYRDD